MIKNIQLKIVLIFFILGIVIITGLGLFFSGCLESINGIINEPELTDIIMHEISNIKTILLISLLAFGVISILVGIFLSRTVVKPINKLIKNAEKLTLTEGKNKIKSKNEIDELADTFEEMTTKLKENLTEMSRQKKQIETILLHMTDGVIAFNKEGKVILVNPAATRALAIIDEEATFEEIFKNINIDINMEKIMYLEDWTSTEEKVKVKDRYLNLSFEILKDEKDLPAGIMAVIQDITEHVKLDNIRKEFVADVSHELKTPIFVISGYVNMIKRWGLSNKELVEESLEAISEETKNMTNLVNKLLFLAKDESNNIKREDFDLKELIELIIRDLKILYPQQDIELKGEGEYCIYSDIFLIKQLLINLIENAIKYGDNKKINIILEKREGIVAKIIDRGKGISKENLERVFEKFFREDKARSRSQGSHGLGLAIVKKIADILDIKVSIESEVGIGSRVSINFKNL